MSFIIRDLRDAKTREFLNLEKGSTSKREYNLKFTQLSYYTLDMVVDMINKMNLFVSRLSISQIRKLK